MIKKRRKRERKKKEREQNSIFFSFIFFNERQTENGVLCKFSMYKNIFQRNNLIMFIINIKKISIYIYIYIYSIYT